MLTKFYFLIKKILLILCSAILCTSLGVRQSCFVVVAFYSQGDAGAAGHPGPKGEPGESISAPEVIVSPGSLTVTQNQTATFYCSADGNPKPSVSWSKISGAGLVNTAGQDNKLRIGNADYNDSGSYVCTATNVFGKSKKVVKLFVEGEIGILK